MTVLNVAVIGGGITGAVVATELAKRSVQVVLFDQGRRGPGGRASHRSVDPSSKQILPDDDRAQISAGRTFEFDHGCQFFRADTPLMQNLVQQWVDRGIAAPWKARWIALGDSPPFFGLPAETDTSSQPIYVGVGGMHQIPRQLLASSPRVRVQRGVRVSHVTKNAQGAGWDLWCQEGEAAFHDTAESKTQRKEEKLLHTADAVVVTDVSASQATWHRASAGLPQEFASQLWFAHRPRVPFFSCMVALEEPIRSHLQADAFVGSAPLWSAVCHNSKAGFATEGAECWTLVSTPDFSVQQIQETSMRDRTTGAFRPQEDSYLNTIPGPLLWNAFVKAVQPLLPEGKVPAKPLYLQAQRWGSGLPAPHEKYCGPVVHVDGLDYVARLDRLVYPRPETSARDFVASDQGLFYAGDFCSQRNPGFEAAALSGYELAQYILQTNKGLEEHAE